MARLSKTDKREIMEGMQQWVGEHFDQWSVGNACQDTVSMLISGNKADKAQKYCVSTFWKKINKCVSKTA